MLRSKGTCLHIEQLRPDNCFCSNSGASCVSVVFLGIKRTAPCFVARDESVKQKGFFVSATGGRFCLCDQSYLIPRYSWDQLEVFILRWFSNFWLSTELTEVLCRTILKRFEFDFHPFIFYRLKSVSKLLTDAIRRNVTWSCATTTNMDFPRKPKG